MTMVLATISFLHKIYTHPLLPLQNTLCGNNEQNRGPMECEVRNKHEMSFDVALSYSEQNPTIQSVCMLTVFAFTFNKMVNKTHLLLLFN